MDIIDATESGKCFITGVLIAYNDRENKFLEYAIVLRKENDNWVLNNLIAEK